MGEKSRVGREKWSTMERNRRKENGGFELEWSTMEERGSVI